MHRVADAIETFAKVGGHARDVPAKTEGDIVDGGAAELQAESSSHSGRVSDEALNMEATVMSWIPVCETTCHSHDVSHMFVQKIGVAGEMRSTKLAERFVSWDG